ncbi:MAG: 7TM-DISM domain-containing protein [Pseudomonadota bacterium]
MPQIPLNVSTSDYGYLRTIDYSHLLLDPKRQLTYRDMDQQWRLGNFEQPRNRHAGQGLTRHPTWTRFTLHNDSEATQHLVLEYIDHALPQLDLYSRAIEYPILEHHGQRSIYQRYSGNPGKHSRYYFPVTMSPGEARIFYARIGFQNIAALYPDMRIWQAHEFDNFRYREAFALGSFVGYLGLIFLLALVLLFVFKQGYWATFAAFVASSAFAWGGATGFLPALVFVEGFHWKYKVIAAAFSVSLAAQFSRQLLQTSQTLPRFDWAIIGLALFGIIPVAASVTEYSHIALPALQLQLIGVGILMIAGYLCANQGNSIAIGFTLIWSLYVVALTIHPMRDLGLLDNTLGTYWLGALLTALELTLLLGLSLYCSLRQRHTLEY